MPNILKRPMFSRGGASQGTGVTSGLGRQNFKDKGAGQTTPNPALDDKKAMIDYVSQLKKQAQPTTTQRIGDFLTAFGALRSEFPSLSTGFTALPFTVSYFFFIASSSSVLGSSG